VRSFTERAYVPMIQQHVNTYLEAPHLPADDQPALIVWADGVTHARLLFSTPDVLLMAGLAPGGARLPAGAPVQVGLPNKPDMISGRLTAYGEHDRFMIALGSRAVRGAARVRVDVRAMAHVDGSTSRAVRILDLSSSGARLRADLAPGSDFDLSFVPPGRNGVLTVHCVVVRRIGDGQPSEVGVAFCGSAVSFSVALTQARLP
jgi:hypothetical protein